MKQLLFCLVLIFSLRSNAQKVRALEIGDTLPPIVFGETLLHNAPAKTMGDLKGKLLLLDFWTAGCIGCIQGMPHLDSLQQMFKDKIQVVIVCKNKRKVVEKVFKVTKKQYPVIPMMLNDTLLNKLFPHMTVPLHVWVDQKGVVRFITYDHNATAGNISRFLNGEPLHLAVKKELVDFNDDVNLFSEGNGRWNKDIQYHTLYAKSLDGVEHTMPTLEIDTINKCATIRAINVSIRRLFQYAYNESFGDGIFYQDSRLDMRTQNNAFDLTVNDQTDSQITWFNKHARASYEAVLPGTDPKYVYMIMRRDLNMYSPFVAHIEKQKVKCLVLTNVGIKPTKGRSEDSTFVSSQEDGLKSSNYSIQNSILPYLQDGNLRIKTPIVDGTAYYKGVDIDLPPIPNGLDDPEKLASVRLALQRNGLDLKEEYRIIDMLVIEDRK